MGSDDGGLRTARPTHTGHARAQRKVGRLVLKPPPSVSTVGLWGFGRAGEIAWALADRQECLSYF